jgi:hypothetical protein
LKACKAAEAARVRAVTFLGREISVEAKLEVWSPGAMVRSDQVQSKLARLCIDWQSAGSIAAGGLMKAQ